MEEKEGEKMNIASSLNMLNYLGNKIDDVKMDKETLENISKLQEKAPSRFERIFSLHPNMASFLTPVTKDGVSAVGAATDSEPGPRHLNM